MDVNRYFDAQRALIGAVLIEPGIAGELFCDVNEEDYSVPELRTLFTAAKALFLEGQAVDPVLVVERTSPAYDSLVREILRDTPTAKNWKAYAKALRDGAQLRRLQELGARLQEASTAEDARQILAESQTQTLSRPKAKTAGIEELLHDFLNRIEDKTPTNFLPWGIRQLDEVLTAEPGDFIVLGADSSVGKTAFAAQLAWTMAARGRRVGFFSLETSGRKLCDRIVAQRAQVALSKIKHKQLETQDFKSVLAVGSDTNGMVFDITEAAGFSVADVRALSLAKRYDVVFIDYVQLLNAAGAERWEIVTRISMELHTMAQQLGIAVVALSQLTPPDKRYGRTKPTKDDLRESRQLKQDADIILLMSLDDADNNESDRWVSVSKNKDGPLGKIRLAFDAEHLSFSAAKTYTHYPAPPKIKEPPPYEQLPIEEEVPF